VLRGYSIVQERPNREAMAETVAMVELVETREMGAMAVL
jgi:hypothetical protein